MYFFNLARTTGKWISITNLVQASDLLLPFPAKAINIKVKYLIDVNREAGESNVLIG